MSTTDRVPNIFYNGCEVRMHTDNPAPMPSPRCTCSGPMLLYIPPGQHVHITCPMHGDTVLHGNPATL